MRIINKSQVNDEATNGIAVSPAIFHALIRCYVTQNANYDDITQVQGILRQARESDAWLECDCKPPLSAFLFPRKLPTGAYTLARPPHHSQHVHTDDCPFHHADFTVSMKAEHPRLNIYAPDIGQSTLNRSMLNILLWLLKEKGLLSYPKAQTYYYIDALKKTADYLTTLPPVFGDVTPASLISTYSKHVVPFYKRLGQVSFPEDHHPHGYIFTLIDSIGSSEVKLVVGPNVQIANAIHNPTKATGPLWGLLLVTEKNKGFFTAHSGVAIPAYSVKQPYVLSNDDERQVFKQLMSVCLSLNESHDCRITKPKNSQGLIDGFTVNAGENQVSIMNKTLLDEAVPDPLVLNYADFDDDRMFRQHVYARLK